MKEWLRQCWRVLRLGRPRINQTRYYASQADVPQKLPDDTLAVVGTAERPKWAILECPCGRGHQLTVSLSRAHRPHWRLSEGRSGATLHPSIDFDSAYRCHFVLSDGEVHWIRSWFRRRLAADQR